MKSQKNPKERKTRISEWVIHILGYTLVLILASHLFKSFNIDLSHFGVYALLLSVILYILNKTVKPILFYLTMPLTGLTLGLFYFVINLIILKIADLLLQSHFDMKIGLASFFIAITISIMNILVEGLIIKPIIRRVEQ